MPHPSLLHTATLLPKAMLAGFASGTLVLFYLISHAAIVFSGEAERFLGAGFVIAVFGTAVATIALAWLTSEGRLCVAPTETFTVFTAVLVAQLVTAFGATADESTLRATVLALPIVATLVVGLTLWGVGRWRLARFVRFIPATTTAGFLASIGALLIVNAIPIALGMPLGEMLSGTAARSTLALQLGFAVLVAATILLARASPSHTGLCLIGALLLAVAVFHFFASALGVDVATLQRDNWLLRAPAIELALPPLGVSDLLAIDYRALLGQWLGIVTMAVMAMLALLIVLGALELMHGLDLGHDRELVAAGKANLIAGLLGGQGAFHGVVTTMIHVEMGAATRLTSTLSALAMLAALAFLEELFVLVPRGVIAGMLLWVGVALVHQWLIKSVRTFGRLEYAIVLVIVATSLVSGLMAGVLAGLLAGALLFVVDYSRTPVIRQASSGATLTSRVMRPEALAERLRRHGEEILALRLQGYLFFGTSAQLLKCVKRRLRDPAKSPLHYLVVDFAAITGLDSTAVADLSKLAALTHKHDVKVVLTNVAERFRKALLGGGLRLDGGGDGDGDGEPRPWCLRTDLDHGLEWCEDDLLGRIAPEQLALGCYDVLELLRPIFDDEADARQLADFMQRVEIGSGERLICQGERADDLFFIERGELSLEIDDEHGGQCRIGTVTAGAILGEMAVYSRGRRSASARATSRVIAWKLSRYRMSLVRERHPELMLKFHEHLASMLSERVKRLNRLVLETGG